MAKRKTIAELATTIGVQRDRIEQLKGERDRETDKYIVACEHAEEMGVKIGTVKELLTEHKDQLGQACIMLEHAAHTIERIDRAGLKLTAKIVEMYGRDGLARISILSPPEDMYDGKCANQETVDMCRGFRMACEDVKKK